MHIVQWRYQIIECSMSEIVQKGRSSKLASIWEVRLAWVFRAIIAVTAVVHVFQGEILYVLVCLLALVLVATPPLLARSQRANIPVELELMVLWWLVADMALGRVASLYETSSWFDKALHFTNPMMLGMLAFLTIYALHLTGRLRISPLLMGVVIALLTLGFGALWEIVEYLSDAGVGRGAQGSPVMSPLDDTMWDLILDGTGGALGALLGASYVRYSRRSCRRVAGFVELVGGQLEVCQPQE